MMVRSLKNITIFLVIILSLSTNVLLITSSGFHSLAVSFLEKLTFNTLTINSPYKKQKLLEAENKRLKTKNRKLAAKNRLFIKTNKRLRSTNRKLISDRLARLKRTALARKVIQRIARRTMRDVAIDIGSMVGEATPYIGISFVVASTALDLKDGCDTIRDINKVLRNLEGENELVDENKVCGMKVPTTEELVQKIKETVGGTLHQSKENIRNLYNSTYEALGGTIYYSKEYMKEKSQKFYDSLGGTLYNIFH